MAPKKKSKAQKKSKTFERVYLILTLIVVAGVAIFLGYVVGQYAIQAATNALDRELAQEGDRVRQQVAETAGRIPPESTAHVETDPKRANGDGAATPAATSPTGLALKEPLKEPERAPTVERPVASPAQNVPKAASGPAPPAVTSGKQLYRVQVGAFSSEANAQSLAKELREKGYPVLVIPGSLHRVQVGAFAERANAESLKRELEGKGFIAAIISTD